MNMFKKIKDVITTLVPTKEVYITKVRGTYMYNVKSVWCGKEVLISVPMSTVVRK